LRPSGCEEKIGQSLNLFRLVHRMPDKGGEHQQGETNVQNQYVAGIEPFQVNNPFQPVRDKGAFVRYIAHAFLPQGDRAGDAKRHQQGDPRQRRRMKIAESPVIENQSGRKPHNKK